MDVLDLFANVGKAVLVQALGLQKNYSELVEEQIDVIDYDSTPCSNCKHCALVKSFTPGTEAYDAAVAACANCPDKTYTTQTVTKKIYHNEKNRYGYKPRLKSNAIKLLLLFHFYHPDRFGIIKGLELEQLASDLSCDVKTIKNNLDILSQYGYISYCKTSAHYINLFLCDYEQYYLPGNKGGRGFIVLSKELLSELISLNNLLALRILLRQIVEIDNLNAKGPFTAVSKTYKEMKQSLPDYCKPCIIRDAIKNSDNIFNISFKQEEKSIRFEIKDRFNCRKQKEECLNQYMSMLKDFMTDFNKAVAYINVHNEAPAKYCEFFENVTSVDKFNLIVLKEFELEDLAQLALQYSYDYVITAYASIYKSYILQDRKIINLGGLVRTAIIALQENHISPSKAA